VPFDHSCRFCSSGFVSVKRNSQYCSISCAAKDRVPEVVARNKARRKYPAIEGMTRYQAWYRGSDKIDRLRDVNKRELLIQTLGGKCVQCGYDKNPKGLVLDHINGDGKEDRKRLGSKIFRHYIKHIEEAKTKLQVLCATCNQIKAFENQEHNRTKRIN